MDADHASLRLAASLGALSLGPLLHQAARRARRAALALQLLVAVAVLALVGLEILPECVELIGWAAAPAVAAGLVGPILAERRLRGTATSTGRATLYLALAALLVHALTDGMALVGGGHDGREVSCGLAVAVALHRVPEGAALWWLARPRGRRAALCALAAVAAATVVGFAIGEVALPELGTAGAALFQAFVAGLMLHVLLHARAPRAWQGAHANG